jgi:hypothetical protein
MKKYIKSGLLVLATFVGILSAALLLPGCFENNGGGGGQEYVGPTVPACLSSGTPAGGYIRTDSIDAGHPGCNGPVGSYLVGVYTRYTGYPVQSNLAVCATEDLSTMEGDGWTPMGLPEREPLGRDNQTSRFRNDPSYKNVVWMKRTSATPH